MSRTPQEPASIFDIVTFGYKQAIKNFGTVFRFCWPILLIYGLSSTLLAWLTHDILPPRQQNSLHNGLSGLLIYLKYAIIRYTCDTYWREPHSNLMAYLKPERVIKGLAGIAFITFLYAIGAGLAGLVGLLLLVVPGIAIFSYFYVWSGLFYTAYLINTENGIFAARGQISTLLKGNFKRTAGLGFLIGLVYCLTQIPVFCLIGGLAVLQEQPHASLFYGLYASLSTLVEGFVMMFSFTGYCFILNRYYEDLKVRREQGVLHSWPGN